MFIGMEPAPTKEPTLSFPSPTDLRFSQLGSKEVKLHWTNPAQPVQQYRVVYHSAESQSPQEVRNTVLHLGMLTFAGVSHLVKYRCCVNK